MTLCSTTSGAPPLAKPTTRTLHRHALEEDEPERLFVRRYRDDVRSCHEAIDVRALAQELHAAVEAELPRELA